MFLGQEWVDGFEGLSFARLVNGWLGCAGLRACIGSGLPARTMTSAGQGDPGSVGREPEPRREKSYDRGERIGRHTRTRLGKKIDLGGYFPKTTTIPAIQIKFEKVRGKIELWKEKALIRKFVGIWPKEKDLVKWINSVCNLKGHYELHVGSKGFFTIIFFN